MNTSRLRRTAVLSLGLTLAGASGVLAGTLTVRPGIPSVGGLARYSGNHGLDVNVASPNRDPAFVQSNHPAAEGTYRLRFYLNLRGLTMSNGDEFDVFAAYDGADPVPPATAGNAQVRVAVRRMAGENWLTAFARLDNGTQVEIPSTVALADGWRAVEIDWARATAGANGRLNLWVDGEAQDGLSSLDNDTASINYARWGTVNGVDAGTSGRIKLDDFASQRTGYVGLVSVFADVPATHGLWPFIQGLYAAEVTSGCGAGQYCPNTNATRDQMAVFLLLSKEGSGYSPPACTTPMFNDVPCSSPFAIWINELARRGITGGCGNGNFCPTGVVTRGQMAVFLLATFEGQGYAPPACTSPMFNDVPCSSGLAVWINELARRGVTGGCGNGNYCPSNSVTRGQMAVFLTGTFSLPIQRIGP
jgi:hypothetical protein